jgi:osmoprotectant transport system permease protein
MGMSGRQVLSRVELPLATPVLLVGVQLATIQVIATATIAALVAGPGLGRIITAGFGLQDEAQVVAGALLVAALALLADLAFIRLYRRVSPGGVPTVQ